MYNFKVRSSIHDYIVFFIDDVKSSIKGILEQGDTLLIDKKVRNLYSYQLDEYVNNNKCILIDATEEQKSYSGLIPIINELIESGFKRDNKLIAIGGGITQDITAFIASILYRGVIWLFYPTTLLAQGDSCIGSKTSVNFGKYKNQVGGFYPPKSIFININFLETLSDLDLKSGFGEMCHYFVIEGESDFNSYKNEYPEALKNKKLLLKLIKRSLEIKKSYIEIDEYEKNKRQIFNYGHSFGHAIESLTNYRIPHGIAVAYGMDIANFISVKKGLISEDIRNNIRELLELIWENTHISDISIENFQKALSKDKKNVGEELRVILNGGFGNIFKTGMKNDNQLREWLIEYFNTQL